MAALSLTLYDHAADLVELIHLRMECSDPQEQAQFDKLLHQTIGNTRDKVDKCSHALAALETLSAAAAEEIARLKRRQQQADAAAASLKAYLLGIMQAHGLKRMDGHTTGFTLRNNAPSVEIEDEERIPDQFLAWKETCCPDKKLIKAALAQGQPVDGARLVQTLSLVRR